MRKPGLEQALAVVLTVAVAVVVEGFEIAVDGKIGLLLRNFAYELKSVGGIAFLKKSELSFHIVRR